MENFRINRLKIFLAIFILCGAFVSCELNDFSEMNYDKKQPTKPVTSYLLTHSIRHIPSSLVQSAAGDPQSSYFVKYLSYLQYSEFYNFWAQELPYYQSVLINLQEIIDQNTNEDTKASVEVYGDNNNQLAVARILRAYYFWSMTDRWGDIPYFESLQGQANIRPVFDTQEEIYNDLFKELTEAAGQITTDFINPLKGDFLFNSDMSKWLKFANTTRLVMAMRISDVSPDKAKSEFQSALNAPGGVIEDVEENLKCYFVDDEEQVNFNLFYNWYNSTIPEYVPNEMLIDHLEDYNDPRLSVYAEPAALSGEYVGKNLQAGQTDKNSVSLLGSNFREKESPLTIYSYSQVLFTLSEAALKGWVTGGESQAEQYYEDAIAASFRENGVYEDDVFNDYVSQSMVAFTSAEAYEKIGTEKWIALFPRGNEAWAEWRRLDYPVIVPVANALTEDGSIPVRNTFSDNIVNLMPEQWAEVNERQPDKSYTRIWWDVN